MKYRVKPALSVNCMGIGTEQQRHTGSGRHPISHLALSIIINRPTAWRPMVQSRCGVAHYRNETCDTPYTYSASHKGIVEANPYGDETQVQKSNCTGHVQKRMGSALHRLVNKNKGEVVIPTSPGAPKRTGISGRNGLTKKVIDQMQNYYGMAIRSHLGDMEGMIKAINAVFGHFSNDHQFCPDGEGTWCKKKRGDPAYKPKDISPEFWLWWSPSSSSCQTLIS